MYVFKSFAPENMMYRDVNTNVEGSICVIKKRRIIIFLPLNLNRASPYAAGIASIVEIAIAPNPIIALFLNPLSVSLEADNCFWKASSVSSLGHRGVGIWKISTCVFSAVTSIQYRGNIKITNTIAPIINNIILFFVSFFMLHHLVIINGPDVEKSYKQQD